MQDEAVGINPRINCVFKAILGDPSNKDVLLDFLNAVVQPSSPFVAVEILNPQHVPELLAGKETVLDVKATDVNHALFQVEMQTWNVSALRGRMVFNNAELFVRQGRQSMDYAELLPAISIWLLEENILRGGQTFHHRFVLYDPDARQPFSEHLEIHTLELDRWRKGLRDGVDPRERGWMEFFSSAETWARLPDSVPSSPAMEKAMTTLRRFRENEDWYRVYASQEEAQRIKATLHAEQQRDKAARLEAERQLKRVAQQILDAEQQLRTVQQQRQEAERQRQEAEQQRQEAERQRQEAEAALHQERAAAQAKDAALEAQAAELAQLRARLRQLGPAQD